MRRSCPSPAHFSSFGCPDPSGPKTEALRRSQDVSSSATGVKSACFGPAVGNPYGKYLIGDWRPPIHCNTNSL